MNDEYSTTMLPFPHRGRAEVLHGTWGLRGVYVAITIRVKGSAWVCHPHKSGDDWLKAHGSKATQRTRPPRYIRKAAKMALRRWLKP